MSTGSILVLITAIISVTFSCTIILTAILFPILRKKMFFQIICYITLADIVGNSLYLNPNRPRDGSVLCGIEGFIHLYSYPVSWLWTTVLMYFLYSLAFVGQLPLSLKIIHLICWGLPLLLTLLNLTTNRYGRTHYRSYEVCSIVGNNQIALSVWHYTTFYGLWLICVLSMTYMYFKIRSLAKTDLAISFAEFKLALDTMGSYPTALIIFWIPHMFTLLIVRVIPMSSQASSGLYLFGIIFYIMHGIGTTAIFFYHSPIARKLWYNYIFIKILKRITCTSCSITSKRSNNNDNRSNKNQIDDHNKSGDTLFRTSDDYSFNESLLDQEMFDLDRYSYTLRDIQPSITLNPISKVIATNQTNITNSTCHNNNNITNNNMMIMNTNESIVDGNL